MDSLNSDAPAGVVVPPLHPYYPVGVEIPGYVANEMGTIEILGYFAVVCGSILLATYLTAKRFNPGLPAREVAIAMWLTLSGSIHLGLEGYVVRNHATVATSSALLSQAWKEYSLSDSRYLTSDPFVITMEGLTALAWGPLCYTIAGLIIAGNQPLRYPLQGLLSLGQIYGTILYFATVFFEEAQRNVEFSRPEPAYYWGYFVAMNAVWIAIPGTLLVSSVKHTARAFAAAKALEERKKA